jgi:phosphatidate cytidylyltransferase
MSRPTSDSGAPDRGDTRPAGDDLSARLHPPRVIRTSPQPDTPARPARLGLRRRPVVAHDMPDPDLPGPGLPDPDLPPPGLPDPDLPPPGLPDPDLPGPGLPEPTPEPTVDLRKPSGPSGVADPAPRGGRNLPAAIAVGVGLGAVTLGTLYAPPRWPFVVLICVAALAGSWELTTALRTLGARPALVPLAAGGIAMPVSAYQAGAEGLYLALVLTVLGCFLWRVADPTEGYLRDAVASALVAAYVPFLAGFAALLAAPGDGPRRVTVFVVLVVCNDVGGYAAGSRFGKHPMSPVISPKKSWEGLVGSLVLAAVAGAVLVGTLLDTSFLLGALLGVAIVASATLGDLGESMIKRDIGVKDLGTVLPGHGGVMDRLDSLLPSAAVAWLLLAWFV